MNCPDLLQWLVDHQETVSIWTVPVLGLLGIAMGAWRLKLADQEREEQRQSWLMERYARRVERFGKAADKVLNYWGKERREYGLDETLALREYGLDETLALLEIEGIAEADPERFLRQAKSIVAKLDQQERFPSRKEIEEYQREQHAAEEEEADKDEWWKGYHRPYREDEPRVSIFDLSFIVELRRLVAKWGRVPRKQK